MKKIIALTIVFVLSMAMVLPVHADTYCYTYYTYFNGITYCRFYDTPIPSVPVVAGYNYYMIYSSQSTSSIRLGSVTNDYVELRCALFKNNIYNNAKLSFDDIWFFQVPTSDYKEYRLPYGSTSWSAVTSNGNVLFRDSSYTGNQHNYNEILVNHGMVISAPDGTIKLNSNESFLYNYNIKYFDESNNMHELKAHNRPYYIGTGANYIKVQTDGPYIIDGVEKPEANLIVRVKNLVTANFDIKDQQGRYVLGLTKGTKVRKITGKVQAENYLDTAYSKIQWYYTRDNIPTKEYTEQNSISNDTNAAFNVLDGFVAFRCADLSTWDIQDNSWIKSGEAGSDDPVLPGDYEEVTQKPNRADYEDGIMGNISYSLDTAAYYVKMPFVFIASMLQGIVTMLSTVVTQTGGVVVWLKQMFSFLPTDVQVIIGGLFSVVALTACYSLIRK